MKKRLLFLIASFAIITSAFACKVTNMCVRQTDGTIVKYDIEKVEEVYYEDIDIPSTPSEPEEEEPETSIPEINPSNPDQVTPQFRYFVISETEAEVIGLNVGSTNIVVPSSTIIDGREYKITSIGDNAFENLRRIETVTLPNTITNIGTEAFKGCSYLYDINIPSKASISDNAFVECQNLTFVHFGNELTKIGNGAFMGCKYLYDITLPSGVKNIGDNAFLGCSGLKTVSLPESVTYIGTNAFSGCNNLEIKINNKSENVKVGTNALKDCKKVVYLKDILPEIVDAKTSDFIFKTTSDTTAKIVAYKGSKSDVIVPEFVNIEGRKYTVTSIENSFNAEEYWEDEHGEWHITYSDLRSITLPKSITEIENGAFNNQNELISITLPEGITSIGNQAFRNCEKLNSITLPESTRYIGDGAFYNCNKLKSINIPDNVTYIGSRAFEECNSISTLVWPDNITDIKECTFFGCSNLTEFSIPNNVTHIGHGAFFRCSNLVNITIPNEVTQIDSFAFFRCSNLDINIDNYKGNIAVKDYAFFGCKSVRYLDSGNYPDFYFSILTDSTVCAYYQGPAQSILYYDNVVYEELLIDLTCHVDTVIVPDIVDIEGKTYKVTAIGGFASLDISYVYIPNTVKSFMHGDFAKSYRTLVIIDNSPENFYLGMDHDASIKFLR